QRHERTDVAATEGGRERGEGGIGQPPPRAASERGEQVAGGGSGARLSRSDGPAGAVQVLSLGEPGPDLGDDVGVKGCVPADGGGEVPSMDEVVCAQLVDVLAEVLLSVRELHGP